MPPKSSFLDKVLGRIGRLDAQGLQTVVQRLARERTFLETLFNTIEDGVLVVDETKRIIYFNSAVSNLLGIPPTAEGQSVNRYLPEFDWERLMKIDAVGGPRVIRQEIEVTVPRPRYLHLYAAPLDGEKSGSAGVALILRDATEARAKTFQAIEDERVQALTLLAASVAHEIGNPLNALHIHLQLMERELRKLRRNPGEGGDLQAGVDRLEGYVHVAKGEIGRLDNIVTQFLDALRARAPKMAASSVNQILRETLDLLRPEIENRGQKINEKLSGNLPEIPCDAAQIKQVFVNLIRNAMQAMSKGGELSVETGANAEAVFVSIIDTGNGIPEEKLNQLFQPFFTTKKKGSGLGLMIVQRIIREHAGRIDVESKPGRGTTFRVWLPLHERRPRLLHAGGTESFNAKEGG
ncbi:MAG: two-component system sensor histidine kinase NtrB [Limisphaerales bacterium]